LDRHSANLLHCRSPFTLRLERVVHWERIASRWRPAFSSHLINAVLMLEMQGDAYAEEVSAELLSFLGEKTGKSRNQAAQAASSQGNGRDSHARAWLASIDFLWMGAGLGTPYL
ncbi:MAG: hypothetical protein WA581_05645, partial [Candidatus Acidiferrales bacterium]